MGSAYTSVAAMLSLHRFVQAVEDLRRVAAVAGASSRGAPGWDCQHSWRRGHSVATQFQAASTRAHGFDRLGAIGEGLLGGGRCVDWRKFPLLFRSVMRVHVHSLNLRLCLPSRSLSSAELWCLALRETFLFCDFWKEGLLRFQFCLIYGIVVVVEYPVRVLYDFLYDRTFLLYQADVYLNALLHSLTFAENTHFPMSLLFLSHITGFFIDDRQLASGSSHWLIVQFLLRL